MDIESRKIHGFSMVELCLVIVVLAVLMIPVFAMMSKGSSATIRNRNEILAQQYAMNIVAYCNIISYDDPFLQAVDEKPVGDLFIKLGADKKLDMDIKEEGFKKIASRTISIKDFNAGESWPKKYKVVTVKVSWQQPGELKRRDVTVSGLVTSI